MLTVLELCLGTCKSSRECTFELFLPVCVHPIRHNHIISNFCVIQVKCSCMHCSQLPKLWGQISSEHPLPYGLVQGHGRGRGRDYPARSSTGSATSTSGVAAQVWLCPWRPSQGRDSQHWSYSRTSPVAACATYSVWRRETRVSHYFSDSLFKAVWLGFKEAFLHHCTWCSCVERLLFLLWNKILLPKI